ncbi:MAG: alpha-ketoacid dehydrogenase subunit beta [Erysipelotrichales bacterium]|nr:alpha-ketoacid dehydrogenase subunit beta [Erysipelotrichales bacterium]
MFKLVNDRTQKGKELRKVAMETVADVMNTNDKVVMLEADLAGASASGIVQKAHPDRYIQVGIAEANMVGMAAGLSLEGFRPFIHTFAPFASRRVYDQMYLSGAYAFNTINVFGTDPGFTVAANGGTHTSFEDIALYRAIPNVVILDPADATQLAWAVREVAPLDGIHYLRFNRKDVRNLYEPGSTFQIGKAEILKEGKDALIISAGQLLNDALDAAEKLEAEGVSTEVIDLVSIKPLDAETVLKEVAGKKAVITVDNHNIIGGLGSAVSEVLAENGVSVPFKRVGVKDVFGQVGTAAYLQKEFGLTADDMAATIKGLLK